MRILAGMEFVPRMTVQEYFRGCEIKSGKQSSAFQKWRTVIMHDLFIKVIRSEIPHEDVKLLRAIKRNPMNHLDLFRQIYEAAEHVDAI